MHPKYDIYIYKNKYEIRNKLIIQSCEMRTTLNMTVNIQHCSTHQLTMKMYRKDENKKENTKETHLETGYCTINLRNVAKKGKTTKIMV